MYKYSINYLHLHLCAFLYIVLSGYRLTRLLLVLLLLVILLYMYRWIFVVFVPSFSNLLLLCGNMLDSFLNIFQSGHLLQSLVFFPSKFAFCT